MRSRPFSIAALEDAFPSLGDFKYLDSGAYKAVYSVNTESGSFEVLKLVRIPPTNGSRDIEKLRNQELGRLKREISLLGEIDSPFIVSLGSFPPTRVLVGGEDCVAYSEELLPGQDLKAVIAKGSKPNGDEIRVLLKTLVKAIQALWKQKRTVHRDIKPANIFATHDAGRPYVILDLGIAYNVLEPGLTLDPSNIPATPLYMAPEMLDPHFREILSYRADLYAAGLTVFEFATGGIHALAKKGDDYGKTVSRVLHQEPTRLKDLRPDLPDQLTSLIDQLIRKKPSLRPGNFNLIHKALNA